MVLLIIIPIKWLFHWEYTLFSDKPTWGQYDDLAVGCVETTCHRLKKRPLDQAISRLWNCSPCKFPCFGKDWNHLPSLPRVDRRGNQWYQWFRSSPFGTHPFLLEISTVFRFVSWLLVIDSRKFLGGIISIFVALTSPFLLVESSFLCWHLLFWQVKFGQTLIFTDSRRMIKWWNNVYIYTHIHTCLTDQITKPCLKHGTLRMILLGYHRNPFWTHPRRRRLGRRHRALGRAEMGPPWYCASTVRISPVINNST